MRPFTAGFQSRESEPSCRQTQDEAGDVALATEIGTREQGKRIVRHG
jgi:hypothetical protein